MLAGMSPAAKALHARAFFRDREICPREARKCSILRDVFHSNRKVSP
jgi:hypothetical protein